MSAVAFDAKDFRRGRLERYLDQKDPTQAYERYFGFHTPLGCGVWFKDPKDFVTALVSVTPELAKSFGLQHDRPFYSSTTLKRRLGLQKAIAFTDRLITALQQHLKLLHVTYLVLPPPRIPKVTVGGYRSPERDMETAEFLTSLGPMFSYLTAYSFLGKPVGTVDWEMHIDGFRSKSTIAWNELIAKVTPKIYFHGDECHPLVCCADLMAFLTDAKLYTFHRPLTPDGVEEVWKEYSFRVDVRFFDERLLSKIRWYDENLIDYNAYLPRPIVFLMIDDLSLLPVTTPELETPEIGVQLVQPPALKEPRPAARFKEVIAHGDVFGAAVHYAFRNGGCVKIFHPTEDADKIRDGDVLAYVGMRAKQVAEAYSHAYDVKVLSGRDLRRLVGKE